MNRHLIRNVALIPSYIIITSFLTTVYSCTTVDKQQAEDALLVADSNRIEMERVLRHYEDEPDELKRQSAWFLISNMPYHVG